MEQKRFEIETGLLQNDITAAEGVLSALTSDVSSLREALDKLSSMWEGVAKQQMASSVQADINSLEQMVQSMRTFVQNAAEARDEYNRCEADVAATVDNIKV